VDCFSRDIIAELIGFPIGKEGFLREDHLDGRLGEKSLIVEYEIKLNFAQIYEHTACSTKLLRDIRYIWT